MDIRKLLSSTSAFKILKADKQNNTLSHAILVTCDDILMLETYLTYFAKLLACKSDEPCLTCRTCSLIDKRSFVDATFYPIGKKILVQDIDDLIEKSYFKPLESENKLFVLLNAHEMNAQAQNKLLKTLENPPANTIILLGATTTNTLLSTVLSRVKKLEIGKFSDGEIINVLSSECSDLNRLQSAVKLSFGKVGEALNKYNLNDGNKAYDASVKVLLELLTSKQVASFSAEIDGEILNDFISITSRLVEEAMLEKSGIASRDKNVNLIASKYTYGALIYVQDKLREAEKSLHFNGNATAIKDALLFGVLEGKYKWSK
ncbi:MAG: hypothetical protein J6R29_02020 [Clostridia bacterium]|nr:hypothetical protein [Clostridia bacterium]